MALYHKRNPIIELQRQRSAVSTALTGRTSASSTNLSASYGLPLDQVQALMRVNGVRDDG